MHFPVTALGPGARIGVWFQGCSIRCPGCVSLDTWAHDRGRSTVDAVLHAISPSLATADGITVSGGEPFDQPEALFGLLAAWRAVHAGDILVYSGYSLENLAPSLARFENLIDALITDPFRNDLPQTLALRGSDNQRLVTLTPLGEERFRSYERPLAPKDRSFDIMFDDETGGAFLAGIPRPGDMARLTELLREAGHLATTSADVRP